MTTNIADLVARLRAYRPPSADMSMPREHHPICDTAATALEAIARERDEARTALTAVKKEARKNKPNPDAIYELARSALADEVVK